MISVKKKSDFFFYLVEEILIQSYLTTSRIYKTFCKWWCIHSSSSSSSSSTTKLNIPLFFYFSFRNLKFKVVFFQNSGMYYAPPTYHQVHFFQILRTHFASPPSPHILHDLGGANNSGMWRGEEWLWLINYDLVTNEWYVIR